jgi:hypothetical protein
MSPHTDAAPTSFQDEGGMKIKASLAVVALGLASACGTSDDEVDDDATGQGLAEFEPDGVGKTQDELQSSLVCEGFRPATSPCLTTAQWVAAATYERRAQHRTLGRYSTSQSCGAGRFTNAVIYCCGRYF